jgi:hypothetical protein
MSDFDYEYSIGKLQELFPSLRGMEWKIVSFEDWIKQPRRQYQTFCSSPSRVCRIFIVLDLWTTKVENGFQFLLVDVVMHGDGALFRRLVEDESDEVVRRRAARALRLLACDKAIPLLIMTTSSRNRPLLASLLILDDMLYRMN